MQTNTVDFSKIKLVERSPNEPSTPLVVGESPALQQMLEVIRRVAATDASVCITGESGTGKELAARAIHTQSARCNNAFIAINCAAVPASLIESELFGHVRGAFTDAKGSRAGLFAQANGGTLFLDEIGEFSMEMQSKLLRALQERTVRPVGGDQEVPFDIRLITATNRDLEEEITAKRFREDLYYRINVVNIRVPSLRERGNDVLLLAHHFVERFSASGSKRVRGICANAEEKLLAYQWPGNVRELENCIERAVALCELSDICMEDLPDRVRGDGRVLDLEGKACNGGAANDSPDSTLATLDEIVRQHIINVLKLTENNKSQAAKILNIDRRTLHRKLEYYNTGHDLSHPS